MNTPASKNNSDLGMIFGVLLMRLWLGLRTLQSGIEKFAGTRSQASEVVIDGTPNEYGLTEVATAKVYGFDLYRGVPESMYARFKSEPLIPEFFLNLYDITLGPLLILVGLTVLLGICSRISLFVMGLIYTSLTFGLILLNQDAGVAWLGTHIILVAMMLFAANYNRFEITGRKNL